MSFPHLAKVRASNVSRDPLPAMAQAMNGLLILHRELMAERDETLRLTRELCENKQSVAELSCYVALLEREVARLKTLPPAAPPVPAPRLDAARTDDAQAIVEGWR